MHLHAMDKEMRHSPFCFLVVCDTPSLRNWDQLRGYISQDELLKRIPADRTTGLETDDKRSNHANVANFARMN